MPPAPPTTRPTAAPLVPKSSVMLPALIATVAGIGLWLVVPSDDRPLHGAPPAKAAPAPAAGTPIAAPAPFPEPYDDPEKSADQRVPVDRAAAALHAPPGFRVSLFAGEPDIRQPVALTFDTRGRLWVVECHTYADRKRNFDTSLRDRVLIFEDADNDGRFDKRTVFWDQGIRVAGIEVGHGGVWLAAAPQLLFIPDRDADDRPDGPPEVVLDGFDGGGVRHNILNGLRWAPDGRLTGRHGILATSNVGAPGTPAAARTKINCGLWAYDVTSRRFEVLCHGTTNPWGHDWDAHGQLFFINTVIGHLWHVVPGALYRRMYGEHFNPHAYELIEQTADHFHWDTTENWSDVRSKGVTRTSDEAGGGHAHSGLMIYQESQWPAEWRGLLTTLNLHGRRANVNALERRGAGYVGLRRPDILRSDDPWFRGIELAAGPDGGVYVLDWSDTGECHENDGVHRNSGRIFKITHGPAAPPRPDFGPEGDLAKWSDERLAALAADPREWWVRQARRILHERFAAGRDHNGRGRAARDMNPARAVLRDLLAVGKPVTTRLRAMWALHSTGGIDEKTLIGLLQGRSDEHVRTWAVQLLTAEGRTLSAEARAALRLTAGGDSSGLVLCFLTSAMRTMPAAERWDLAAAIAARRGFADDPVLPKLLWYAIEPAVPGDPAKAASLAGATTMPLLQRCIARRLASGGEVPAEGAGEMAKLLAASADAGLRREVLAGWEAGLRGRRSAPKPPGWDAAGKALAGAAEPDIRSRGRRLSALFGDAGAVEELRAVVRDAAADAGERQASIAVLAELKAPGLAPLLTAVVTDPAVGPAAIRALASVSDAGTPGKLLSAWGGLSAAAKAEAADTLGSRPAWAKELVAAVAAGTVPKTEVSAFLVRRMRTFGDAELERKLAEFWPETRGLSDAAKAKLAKLRKTLTPDRLASADLAAGKAQFVKLCANCHVLFGEGRKVGPDLTGSQRGNLDYLLDNILDPSAEVAADFRVSVVRLEDERVLNGVVVARDARTLTLQTPTERLVLPAGEVAEVKATKLSLMPEGLLDGLGDKQAADLFAWLMHRAAAVPAKDAAKTDR